jgi:drug/metabolite transporter (DMT)-like permease
MNVRTGAAAYLALLLAVAIWGFNFHVVHIGLLHFPLYAFLALRFVLAAVSYTPKLFLRRLRPLPSDPMRSKQPLTKAQFVGTAILVGTALGIFYSMQSSALQERFHVVNTAFLTVTVVLWVPLLTSIMFRRRGVFTRDVAVGILLTMSGVGLLESRDLANLSTVDLLALGGAIALAVELIVIGEVAPRLPSYRLLSWTALYTAVSATAFVICWVVIDPKLFKAVSLAPTTPLHIGSRWAAWCAVVFSGVLATALANYLANWANAQKRPQGVPFVSATHRSIIENLDAPLAFAFGYAFFRWNTDPLEWRQLGYVLILLGVLTSELRLASRTVRQRKASHE